MQRADKTETFERRKYARVPIDCVIKCEKYAIGETDGTDSVSVDAMDMSAGGLLLQTNQEYVLGDVLRIEIELPGWNKYKVEFIKPDSITEDRALVALASVVRVERLAESGYEIGVRLAGVDDGHRLAFERYIYEKVKEIID